jgi:hypothetical protein
MVEFEESAKHLYAVQELQMECSEEVGAEVMSIM